ncbi:hypothetical protein [Lactobacillus bombicola]|uniref:hypothetical protein n=1 Tax=Lactobacillus bombicola TaxID=1505723 RepID=UPI0015F872F4|nr:hypothetical protein [Lactobacillus bombicola]
MQQFFNFVPLILFTIGLIFVVIAGYLFNLIVGFLITGLALIILAVLIGTGKGG